MALGGNNTFVAGNYAASSNGSFSYTGGSGEDSLTFGDNFAGDDGTATFDMSLGGDNTLVFGDNAAGGSSSSSIAYTGGSGSDSLTFGTALLSGASSTATVYLDLGDDSAIDTVTFEGSVASSGATVTIINFDPSDGDTIVLQLYSNTADVTFTQTGGGSGTRVNASNNVEFLIQGVPTGSLDVTTNTSGHVVITEATLILD